MQKVSERAYEPPFVAQLGNLRSFFGAISE